MAEDMKLTPPSKGSVFIRYVLRCEACQCVTSHEILRKDYERTRPLLAGALVGQVRYEFTQLHRSDCAGRDMDIVEQWEDA